ncbi:MAG: hypothetical protein KAX49_15280 [Halanaerobiales bacterium]|nr:hypothetical protein [Halanaerobiales bacterium]
MTKTRNKLERIIEGQGKLPGHVLTITRCSMDHILFKENGLKEPKNDKKYSMVWGASIIVDSYPIHIYELSIKKLFDKIEEAFNERKF